MASIRPTSSTQEVGVWECKGSRACFLPSPISQPVPKPQAKLFHSFTLITLKIKSTQVFTLNISYCSLSHATSDVTLSPQLEDCNSLIKSIWRLLLYLTFNRLKPQTNCRSQLFSNALKFFCFSHRMPLKGILRKTALLVFGEGNTRCLTRILNASFGRTSVLFFCRGRQKKADSRTVSKQLLFSSANNA